MHMSIGYFIQHYFHQDPYIFIQKFLIATGTVLTIYVYIADLVYQYKLRKKEIEKQKEYDKLPKIYVRSHNRRNSRNRVYSVKGYYRVKK